jgi:hypothetical protein
MYTLNRLCSYGNLTLRIRTPKNDLHTGTGKFRMICLFVFVWRNHKSETSNRDVRFVAVYSAIRRRRRKLVVMYALGLSVGLHVSTGQLQSGRLGRHVDSTAHNRVSSEAVQECRHSLLQIPVQPPNVTGRLAQRRAL